MARFHPEARGARIPNARPMRDAAIARRGDRGGDDMTPGRVTLMGTLLLLAVAPVWSQSPPPAGAAPEAPVFSQSDLEQIVAPIALYPDSLMLQIMMASTYPLEIVQAHRWLQANPGLSGDKLEAALKDEDWDPSVKSLCGFPELVKRFNDNLDWTKDMGDAFLAQQNDLLNAVQAMRAKASEAGSLKTTEQQTVIVREEVIIIEPADPQVVYVPTYYPSVVYGSSWVYPWRYPVVYSPPPAGWAWRATTFAAGMWAGAALYSHCDWNNNWHGGGGSYNNNVKINVDVHDNFVNRTNNANRAQHYNRGGQGGSNWNHDPAHRRGVNYRSPSVSNRYGGSGTRGPVSNDMARGRERAGTSAGTRPSTGTGSRPSARPSTGTGSRPTARPSTGSGTRSTARPSTGSGSSGSRARPQSSSASRRDSALSGSRQSSMDRASRSRGQASRGGYSSGSRSSGRSSAGRSGGSRGGGSRGGGGGRR
jgi:hypothetical protein